MLSFFKRPTVPVATTSKPQSVRSTVRTSSTLLQLEPLPTPKVIEGNEDSDWAMWEDSVSFLDSQMPPEEANSVRVRQADVKAKPMNEAPPDPFASVGRKGS